MDRWIRWLRAGWVVLSSLAISGCAPEPTEPTPASKVDVYWSLGELRAALSDGTTTAEAVTKQAIERIHALDDQGPQLGAVIDINDTALEAARAVDVSLPLGGVPVLIKANIDLGQDLPTHAGALAIATHRAADPAFLVQRLRDAGAVILGSANLSEWANFRDARSVSGWSSIGGQTRNPFVLNRSPCGSSSGSAVAVAAGYVPIAIGTETHGSVVCPAGTNGVVGIKPTLGLVSRDGIIPIAASQDTAGPMARSVADAAAALQAMAVFDAQDPAANGHPRTTDMLAFLQSDSLRDVRLGVWRRYLGANDFPRVEGLYTRALETAVEGGAKLIDPVGLGVEREIMDASFNVLLHQFQAGLSAYAQGAFDLDQIIQFNRKHRTVAMPWFAQSLLLRSRDSTLSPQVLEIQLRAGQGAMRARLDALFEKFNLDVIVAPTNAPAWVIDVVNGDRFGLSSASLAAVSGRPAVTIPMGHIRGLPVGISLIGKPWRDAELLGYAFALEERLPVPIKPEFVAALEP